MPPRSRRKENRRWPCSLLYHRRKHLRWNFSFHSVPEQLSTPISLSLLLYRSHPSHLHRLYLSASPSLSADTALSGLLMRCQLFRGGGRKTSFIHLIFRSSLWKCRFFPLIHVCVASKLHTRWQYSAETAAWRERSINTLICKLILFFLCNNFSLWVTEF